MEAKHDSHDPLEQMDLIIISLLDFSLQFCAQQAEEESAWEVAQKAAREAAKAASEAAKVQAKVFSCPYFQMYEVANGCLLGHTP